jgi:DNA-binding transcriptional regulator YhcF (GntR family)
MSASDVTDRIRNRIIGEMHLGHLRAGDRLPGVRHLARELSADHRAVAAAFRALEEEGLVEVRGRTGTFLARQERVGGEMANETAEWLAAVLTEARRRRLGIPDFPDFVRGSTSRVRLRAVCVDAVEDASAALCMELLEEFGVEPVSVHPNAFPAVHGRARPEPHTIPQQVHGAHLVVSSVFHAHPVKAAAEAAGKPFVLTTLNEEMTRIVERRLRQDTPLTVVMVDLSFAERLRAAYAHVAGPQMIRPVLAGDRPAIARLDRSEPVLATRAARRALPDLDVPLLLPRFPSISLESTRELAAAIIRLNLETPAASSAPAAD